MEPKQYDMSKPEDMKRWFREMEGYMKRANEGKGFVSDGTDKQGRQFALDAFYELRGMLLYEI